MASHDIIVVGASAGGVEALQTLAGTLPPRLPAAVFVVLHMPPEGRSLLASILSRSGPLPASEAVDKQHIERGHIYVASPDHHLLLERQHMRVVRGPKENRHRPAVDPLFRTAAYYYGPRVIGVVLTGALDDGTAGLLAIKQRGGLAVVQDPEEALYPSMPASALRYVQVDYTLPIIEIGSVLFRLAKEQAPSELDYPASDDMKKEIRIVEMDKSLEDSDERAGVPSAYSCPECGGVLWELHDGELVRFRCRVGHAFSSESILSEQDEALEEALWAALKTLEENRSLTRSMANRARKNGHDWLANDLDKRSQEAE